ncbi:MAG: alpha-ketoglutarate-dependent dioxygenase AlkB [Halioglobus sp.]|nr:alpha-ketoglutarate-dependent dioxygenase AlkB [Halioglobus sp.]
MPDLFSDPAGEVLPLADADLLLWRDFSAEEAPDLLQRLVAETPWKTEHITVWGKTHPQPRLVAWYGDADAVYTYSGMRMEPAPWTPLLFALKKRVEQQCDAQFNSVLLNYYRGERDSMGLHADDEPELGPQPVIASLSLGEERRFYFRHKRDKGRQGLSLRLPSGSLLLMRGATQANWKHGIPKESRPCSPRVNLTFRRIFS